VTAALASAKPAFGYMRGGLKAISYVAVDNSWRVYVASADRLTVTSSGEVGIGIVTWLELEVLHRWREFSAWWFDWSDPAAQWYCIGGYEQYL